MRVLNPDRFFTRLGRDGLIGFGESFMAGDWDSDELVALLTPMARNMGTLVPPSAQWLRRWYNSRTRSPRTTTAGAPATTSPATTTCPTTCSRPFSTRP